MHEEDERRLLRVLRDPRVWQSGTFDTPDDLDAAFDAMDAENAAAAAACEELLARPWAAWPEGLQKKNVRTAGMVRQLLERMPAILEKRPAAALQLTSMTLAVAEALDPIRYGHDQVTYLRAQALREHAQVLSFLGRYVEALQYVERSGRAFADLDPELAGWDVARLQIVKALALRLLQRSNEGVALAREAGERFLAFGDRRRFVEARVIEAAMLHDGGAIEQAVELWRSVQGDPDLTADCAVRVTHNIALSLCDLGRGAEEIAPLEECIAAFAAQGMTTERTRSRWKLGVALLGAARTVDAIVTLRTASREFAELDLPVDAALTSLDLADALMANGEPAEVPAICREVVARLTNVGLPMQAAPALSMMREAAGQGGGTRGVTRGAPAKGKRAGRAAAQLLERTRLHANRWLEARAVGWA